MINSFLYATKLRKYLHCPAGGLPRPVGVSPSFSPACSSALLFVLTPAHYVYSSR
ncbi:hypothetical protein HMPREF3185_01381 [Porphyromonas somerae]|uniref:Uncharacterized protein n=1 Tax=Porphyromonas somerae TaxID=322095 RepID=A0A134B696_9PORP|nr:hypothetical protein HMPREF3184_01381 [Porphyromonadaceae bacterium KA00676]KXB75457.1 hypothetical protein HMPREF3185_01381 [Porphyromonas somerae]